MTKRTPSKSPTPTERTTIAGKVNVPKKSGAAYVALRPGAVAPKSETIVRVGKKAGAQAPTSGEYIVAGGGHRADVKYEFRRTLAPNADLRNAIAHGEVTGARVRALRTQLELTVGDIAHVLGMSERNVIRREQGETTLSVADADRAYRLARVADLAVELIGDAERAKKWLKTPHRYLGGETPIAALETEIGTELVMESLYAIAYGGVA